MTQLNPSPRFDETYRKGVANMDRMTQENELGEKIAIALAANILLRYEPVFPFNCYDITDQILALVKEALPKLAKEAGWRKILEDK